MDAGSDTSNDARVGVVIPCRDRAHLLGATLASLRAQSETRWTAIVVDDGSPDPDASRRVVAELEDERVGWMALDERSGPAAALNAGIERAATEWLFLLQAGDRLVPEALGTLLAAADDDDALEVVFSDQQHFGRSEAVIPRPGPLPGKPVLWIERAPPGYGALLRRSLWESLGGFDEATELRAGRWDFELWLRASAERKEPDRWWRCVEQPLYRRPFLHTTSDDLLDDDESAAYVQRKHGAHFERAGTTEAFLAASLARAARAAYAHDDRRRAFALARRAWRLNPTRGNLARGLRMLLPFSWNAALDAGALRRAVPFLGYPLRGEWPSEEPAPPFFVIGMGRSGNTLLRRILTSHSELHLPPETFVVGRCIRRFRREGRRLRWPELVQAMLAEFAFHPEFHTFEMDLAPLAQRLIHAPRRQRHLAFLIDAFFRYHAEVHGIPCRRWGDKTPMNSLDDGLARGDEPRRVGAGVPQTLERLLAVFPDAQFLHIVRDGCDVVLSSLRGGFFDDLELAARRWRHVESQTRRFARRHPERSLDVRYEDLVSKPEEVVRGICAFLGVEFEPSMLSSEAGSKGLGDVPAWFWHDQVGRPITAANAGKARRSFSAQERARLEALIGPTLAECGYPPATAEPES